jgi:hypothetical protein
MRAQSLVLAVALIASASGCDVAFARQYGQTLKPAPALDCLSAALSASPDVASAKPLNPDELGPRGPGFKIVLRDTLAAGWPTAITRVALPDSSARVIVTYTYMGFAAPSPRTVTQWEISARKVLGAVKTTCAPASPDTVECRVTGGPPPSRARACHTVA